MRELSFGKTGDKNSDVARFTTLVTCYKPSLLRDRFGVGGKKRNIAIQLILQQFYKTSCTLFCRPIYRTFSYLCSALVRRRAKRLTKSVRYNKVSLCRGSIPYILLLLGKKYRLFYRGLRYIEVRYIEVSL